MAGGRSSVEHERMFRFDSPESPVAIQRFLLSLDIEWNVALSFTIEITETFLIEC